MARGLIIAVVCLVSFFLFLGLFYQVTGDGRLAAWGAAAFAFIGMPLVMLRLWRMPRLAARCPQGTGLYPECLFVVSLAEGRVTVTHPERPVQRIALSDLKEIVIETNDSGPWGPDVWWQLVGTDGESCSFPGGATGEQAILTELQALPGFNNDRLIQAMGSTSNARFSCWQAP